MSGVIAGSIGAIVSSLEEPVIYDLSDLNTFYQDVGGITQQYGINVIFRTDGTVDINRDTQSNLPDEQDPYTTDINECWVRCTYQSGDDVISGPARGVWHACTLQRDWRYAEFGFPERIGTYRFELSSDSGGSVIEATRDIQLDVGEII